MSRTLLLLLCATASYAQQQAPTQHSPSQSDYPTLPGGTDEPEKKVQGDESLSSMVSPNWYPIPLATRYILKIARDPEMNSLFFTIETLQTGYTTPQLEPGIYFYVVEGYDGQRLVGKSTLQRFVVGKPLEVIGKKQKLPAPPIIAPKHLEMFPTKGYVRLAWQAVDGAKSYRFRLWNEDRVRENQRWKRDTPPRWITEIQQPWIEVHDAPHTSFMYLESGLYRWDVAAVDADGGFLGHEAMGYFRVSRQWFFRPFEVFLRTQYGYTPTLSYHQSSSMRGTRYDLSSSSHRYSLESDVWLTRQVGAGIGLGLRSFTVSPGAENGPNRPFDTLYPMQAHLDFLYRAYLSTVPWGWWLVFNLGLGVEEFPQVDGIGSTQESLHVERPKALGARIGFEVHKRFKWPWELQFHGKFLVPATLLADPAGNSGVDGAFNGEFSLRLFHHWGPHFAMGLGTTYERKRLLYLPDPFLARSTVSFSGWNVALLLQLNYYPDPGGPDSNSTQYWRTR